MRGVVFLEMTKDHDRTIETFQVDHRTGEVTSQSTGITYGSLNEALHSGDYEYRVNPYQLSSGSRAGDDNAWCNFKCSGCCRPLEASRWYCYDQCRWKGARRPQNSCGRFEGRPDRADMDPNCFKPQCPDGDLPTELSDDVCWLGTPCQDLYTFYGIPRDWFF